MESLHTERASFTLNSERPLPTGKGMGCAQLMYGHDAWINGC